MKTEKSFFIHCLPLWMADWKKQGTLKTAKNSNWQGTNYRIYELSKRESLVYAGQGVFLDAVFSFVFYRSIEVFLLFLPLALCCPLYRKKGLVKKRKDELRIQFKDAIQALSSCLSAGYSIENGFLEALRETDRLYGKTSMISEEIRLLLQKIHLNRTVGEALNDFAERSGVDDIKSFADVFLAARESGGELMKIIAKTTDIIGEKIQVRNDILIATASRRLEQKVMSAVPIFIVCYMEVTSPGFFDVLYTTVMGRILMTGCLAVYVISFTAAGRILDIQV